MNKTLNLPLSLSTLSLAVLIIGGALACGNSSEATRALLQEDFWRNTSVEEVSAKLNQGADLHTKGDGGGLTALHFAAAVSEDPSVIALLLDRGADIEAKDNAGGTPLHQAAAVNEETSITALLLDRGANIDARDSNDATPLHGAASLNQEPSVVALLIERGADITAKHAFGFTACQFAEENNALRGTEVFRRLCP